MFSVNKNCNVTPGGRARGCPGVPGGGGSQPVSPNDTWVRGG